MGYKLLSNEINSLFEKLKEEYKIYAPKRFVKQGRYSDTDIILSLQERPIERKSLLFRDRSPRPGIQRLPAERLRASPRKWDGWLAREDLRWRNSSYSRSAFLRNYLLHHNSSQGVIFRYFWYRWQQFPYACEITDFF